jgi:hypothetical protein
MVLKNIIVFFLFGNHVKNSSLNIMVFLEYLKLYSNLKVFMAMTNFLYMSTKYHSGLM